MNPKPLSDVQAQARLVYRKARQVSSVSYNLFTIARKLGSDTPIAGMSATVQVQQSVRSALLKQFPTMESLFGSMDFCECEHCRSVLSPAAYLVDLLQFVDTEPAVWANFVTRWKAHHDSAQYQPSWDTKPDGSVRTEEQRKPYDALIERRPDLPHIALTCENTHTALPYIDIVNEILEYYVANNKLDAAAAHDTGEATTAELLAEPQNAIRGAYNKLRDARYPLMLPFDPWIATVRRFCDYFETPLPGVLEVFRPGDELFAPTQSFDRAAVFMESLGLSAAELDIFTEVDPLAKWYALYGFTTAAEATTDKVDAATGQRIDLNSAKALSRRLDVSYKEIAEIVQTGFVNPQLVKLSLLYRLGVGIHDARFYNEHKALLLPAPTTLSIEDQKRQLEVQAFDRELTKLAADYTVARADVDAGLQAILFNEVLVLADPDAGCDFDLTTLQYADGVTKADPIAFLRINLFVRLWRKLGWSIEETDRALTAFVPQSAAFDASLVNLARQPLKTALIYLAHLKALDRKLHLGKQSRLKLLALWSDISTTGRKPLYAQLFLTPSVLKSDPVFDHPLGQYLSAAGIKIKDHVLALQGALSLTSDEISRILVDAGMVFDTAALSLQNVSLLYRYGLLAKALKYAVRELIVLKQLSGLNPFTPLHHDPLVDTANAKALELDYPFSQTLRFVELADEVRASGLKIEDLDYLLRHRFDATGKYRLDNAGSMALLKSLSEGIRAIRAEHAVADDPGGLSDEVLQRKLGLVLPADVMARFTSMMNGTAQFTATKSGVAAVGKLLPIGYAEEPAIREVPYNATRQEQKLTYQGVLFDAEKAALKARLPKPAGVNLHVPSPLLADLLDNVQQQAQSFFDLHLLKQAVGVQPASGFLDAADYGLLFAPAPATLTQAQLQARVQQQRTRLAQAFLPFLQQRLIRKFIVETMTAQTGADPVLVESLLSDKRLLGVAGPDSLLASFVATAERALTATFFASADGTGATLATLSLDDADTGSSDENGNPLKPAAANSARLEGYLEVPSTGAYRFNIELDRQNAEADLRFPHLPEPAFLKGTAVTNPTVLGDQPNDFLELKAGVPYRFSLDLKKLNGGEARLRVQGETLPKGPLSQLTLYPTAAMDAADRATTLLNKALQLVLSLALSEHEIRYLLTHAADFGGVNLSELPTQAMGDTPSEKTAAVQRFGRFLRLAAYARLKRDLAGGTDDLIAIFESNASVAADKLDKRVYPLIAKLTRRDEATVKASAEALVRAPAVPAFESEKPLSRLWEALQLIERFGVSPSSLLTWTGIVNGTTTSERRFEIARDLKEAIKARFEPDAWQRVAQPIFDKLRQHQRDALAAYVMYQLKFDRIEQLYEYFLIDPGMEPVVQTSRIRLAIASLQLFIQRCLLNMELHVHPSVIDSRQWEWMKRFRVWEANRKIFLYPENWLEPEFRDDKTHLFTELEGALLQGDVSSDLVEDAFLNYLKKLDELARLDIVAMHLEDKDDPAQNILHAIGRTYSEPHKYFYRRYAHQMWTPWEPVSAEIEGDHLAPVVWRDRLYLFWVTFMEKAETPAAVATQGEPKLADMVLSGLTTGLMATAGNRTVTAHLHWSECVQGSWSTRKSGGFGELGSLVVAGASSFNNKDVFVHVSKQAYENGEERGVYVHLGGAIKQAFYLAGRNSVPQSRTYGESSPLGDQPANPYSPKTALANRYSGSGALTVEFRQSITSEIGKTPLVATPKILRQGEAYTLLPCDNNLSALAAPEEAYRNATNPAAVKAAIESGLADLEPLMKPVFYQDNSNTFFVEPSVAEQTVEEWQEWVAPTPQPGSIWQDPNWWKEIWLVPEIPWKPPIPDPVDPLRILIDPGSLFKPITGNDWLANPGTVLVFDGSLIGPTGQSGLELLPAGDLSDRGSPVKVFSGSGLAPGSTVVLSGNATLKQAGLKRLDGGLNVVGGGGFNSALKENFDVSNRSGSGSGGFGAGGLGG